MKRRSGFTLIELMIVLAIVAALAAILTPMGMNALNRAKATQYIADIRNIKSAEQMYYFDNNEATKVSSGDELKGYLKFDELTVGGIEVYTVEVDATSTSKFTVTAAGVPTGVIDQFKLAWNDRSASQTYTVDSISVIFTF